LSVTFERNKYAERMVRYQLKSRDIYDPNVLEAMSRVPRHLFVPSEPVSRAYEDHPLPIGHGQTISQPYMVAFMTQALSLTDRDKVLEIGTGSGYQTAILGYIAREVYTVERIRVLSVRAKKLLHSLGYDNVFFKVGDGYKGWKEKAPFSRILVTAAAPEIPEELKWQLNDNGIMVIPVGDVSSFQELMIIVRKGLNFDVKRSIACRFVPLIEGKIED